MSVTINAKGTSVSTFAVGKGGTVIDGPNAVITPPAATNLTVNIDEDNYLVVDAGTSGPALITTSGLQDLHINPAIGGGQYLILNTSRWPTVDGTLGQVLTTNGAGVLSFADSGSDVYGYLKTHMTGSNGVGISYVDGVNTIDVALSLTATGDATGSMSSGALALTLADAGTAGTYTKVTTDAKGRVTSGTVLDSADLPTYTGTITSSQITTGLGYTPYNSTNPSGYITSSANITGNAATATALVTGRTISATGDATGTSASFDGTADASIALTLASVGTAGTYGSATQVPVLTVDAKGRVTGVTTASVSSSTATSLTGGSTGALVYQSAASTSAFLAAGTSSQVLVGGASAPSWSSSPSGLTSVTATTFNGSLNGNATTATTASGAVTANQAVKLATPRAINGVNFDGTAAITIYDSTKFPSTGGTISGGTTISGNLSVFGLCTTTAGYAGRAGNGGTQSNLFNIYWNGVNASLWIDTTNVGTIQLTSDYRLKKNVSTLSTDALDKVNQLRPVTYEYDNYGTLFTADGVPRIGFIAHELQEVIPSAVDGVKDAQHQLQSLKLDALCAVLTKAVQELSDKVDALTTELNTLKGQ